MAKKSVLLLILLLVMTTSTSYGQITKKKAVRRDEIPSIAIYDAYKIIQINKEVGERPTILNKLEPVGEKKSLSQLKSTASVTECKTRWTTDILNKIKSGYLPNDDQEAEVWRNIKSIQSIEATACAAVDYKNYFIRVIYLSIEVEPMDKKHVPNKLLWISKLYKDQDKLEETTYAGVSIESIYDLKRYLKVKAIADVNNDGFHDIILDDERYAGDGYIILYFTDKGLVEKKEVDGASWD
ncbi:MAG: hypothetical protein AABZ10_07805 [Nitrospirota bacterium]